MATIEELGMIAPPKDGPAVLVYDIENAPGLAWVWGAYDQNVIAMEQDWYLLSFAYKWYGGRRVGFHSIFESESFVPDTTDDYDLALRLAALFDRADVLVAHNGDRFDRRKVNARFLYHGIDPPSPYRTIDTKKEASRHFNNYSNSLKELGRLHELGDKTPHEGFDLWRSCMAGDPKAWRLMERYNRQDVVLLERLYEKLLPWIGAPGTPSAVNHGFWQPGETVCPRCGSGNLIKNGHHRTSVSVFQCFQCKDCRGFSRARKREPQPDGGVELV